MIPRLPQSEKFHSSGQREAVVLLVWASFQTAAFLFFRTRPANGHCANVRSFKGSAVPVRLFCQKRSESPGFIPWLSLFYEKKRCAENYSKWKIGQRLLTVGIQFDRIILVFHMKAAPQSAMPQSGGICSGKMRAGRGLSGNQSFQAFFALLSNFIVGWLL